MLFLKKDHDLYNISYLRVSKNDLDDRSWVDEDYYFKWKKSLKHGINYYNRKFLDNNIFVISINKNLVEFLKPLVDVCDVMWASTWQGLANSFISSKIGLPTDLPFVNFPDNPTYYLRYCFKNEFVIRDTVGRSFIWFDDDVSKYDNEYIASNKKELARAFHVDTNVGLTQVDVDNALCWLKEVDLI